MEIDIWNDSFGDKEVVCEIAHGTTATVMGSAKRGFMDAESVTSLNGLRPARAILGVLGEQLRWWRLA